MLKLYQRADGVLRYHEAWVNDGTVVEHWGIAGELGETRENAIAVGEDEADALLQVLAPAAKAGYRPMALEEHAALIIEFAVDGSGAGVDLDKRHALEERMSETLSWTGLGACDGGSIGSGTMEVCCFVADFGVAKRVIEADLAGTEFSNFTRIYKKPEGG